MSRGLTFVALVFGIGILLLLISLVRTDLTRVIADGSSADVRQSVRTSWGQSAKASAKRHHASCRLHSIGLARSADVLRLVADGVHHKH